MISPVPTRGQRLSINQFGEFGEKKKIIVNTFE
jgi:hypothetical protein